MIANTDPATHMETATSRSTYADAPVNTALTSETKLAFLHQMHRIRVFEQTSLKYYQTGKMGGFLHLYSGQESVAVGQVSLLGEHDHIITAYRDHGHALAVGMSMESCMAELFGKTTGCSKGKGGSMHFFAPDKNYWGGHGIVGGQTPLGAGIAFALKYKGLTGCCLCYLGDGAVNQGAYHESLNLAALWDLPVIFVIENNGYSMGTSQKRSSAYKSSLAERAEGYDMDWDIVNGEDLFEIRAKTQTAIERAHNTSRPTLMEVFTYRYYGHSVADANTKKYRTAEEIERYKNEHDPIQLWQQYCIEEGLIDEDGVKSMVKEIREECRAAADAADEAPAPEVDDIFDDVYYEVDQESEAASKGRYFFND